jgi:hypothetical protein
MKLAFSFILNNETRRRGRPILKHDVTRNNIAIERLLEITTNPRYRFLPRAGLAETVSLGKLAWQIWKI